MNWLAHLLLSEPTPAFRIGNLLPDLLPLRDLAGVPAEFQRGIECHRRIDVFTDAHPVMRRSIQRLDPPYRRFGGIIIDLLYDHFLTREWPAWSAVALEDFAAEVYRGFAAHRADLPALATARLEQIRAGDWICSYHELDGVCRALDRVGQRLRKPVALGEARLELERHYAALQADFAEFFPELVRQFAPTNRS